MSTETTAGPASAGRCPVCSASDPAWSPPTADRFCPGSFHYPATPELDKQHQAIERGAHRLGEFLDWLAAEGYVLARYSSGDSCYAGCSGLDPDYTDREKLVAGFFGIDLAKIEAERMALLEHIRKLNQ